MNTIPPLLLVMALAGIGLAVGLLRYSAARVETMRQRFPDARFILAGANCYGRQSRGSGQMRGNGTLVLTDTELIFEHWLPRSETRIPLRAIDQVDTTKSFRRKWSLRPLLRVIFRTETGATDAIAWLVEDAAASHQAIEAAISGVAG